MTTKSHLCIAILIVALMSVVTGVARIAMMHMESSCHEFDDSVYELGQECHQRGVPATANPYTSKEDRVMWLKGWLRSDWLEELKEAER